MVNAFVINMTIMNTRPRSEFMGAVSFTGVRQSFLAAFLVAVLSAAEAHTPICFCFENDEGGVTCEGGFSDGASAEGVSIRVLDDRDRVLIDGEMNDKSEFVFARPNGNFHVVFDAGGEHKLTIFDDEIE